MDWAEVKGFNYQQGHGSTGYEIWANFDLSAMDRDLARGKELFPKFNSIRLWLSWDAYIRNPRKLLFNFDSALAIAKSYGISVMACLFNRWHDAYLDYGGIYIDHFYGGSSWLQCKKDLFDGYVHDVVGGHCDDGRIVAWDLCNEPFAYNVPASKIPEIAKAELEWLAKVRDLCKAAGTEIPLTIGVHSGYGFREAAHLCDLLSIHPYWTGGDKAAYSSLLDDRVKFASSCGKPLVSSETCWGALDDAKRVEIIRFTLEEHHKRGIGFYAYLLRHSLVADAHRKEYGPIGVPEDLHFIEPDGSLRPGHEVFNEF